MTDTYSNLTQITSEIVVAYISHNALEASQVPALIRAVYAELAQMGQPADAVLPTAPKPAVPIQKSVFPGYIICLEDGKKLKMMKRHLRTTYGLSPAEYRTKWNLPSDYPMVAPSYADHRSALAKRLGLGRKAKRVGEKSPTVQSAVRKGHPARSGPQRKGNRKEVSSENAKTL